MTDWQDDLDDELWDGDGRDPMAEADAARPFDWDGPADGSWRETWLCRGHVVARPFDWDGPADGSWLETWLCRECGAAFATDKGTDPSFCPFCGAGEEG